MKHLLSETLAPASARLRALSGVVLAGALTPVQRLRPLAECDTRGGEPRHRRQGAGRAAADHRRDRAALRRRKYRRPLRRNWPDHQDDGNDRYLRQLLHHRRLHLPGQQSVCVSCRHRRQPRPGHRDVQQRHRHDGRARPVQYGDGERCGNLHHTRRGHDRRLHRGALSVHELVQRHRLRHRRCRRLRHRLHQRWRI